MGIDLVVSLKKLLFAYLSYLSLLASVAFVVEL